MYISHANYSDLLTDLKYTNGSTSTLNLPLNYSSYSKPVPLSIHKVIFNNPCTIILWSDKTKTIVKCGEDEEYDPEKGMAMAISKKFLGNKGNYYETFKKWLPEDIGIDESNLRCTAAKASAAFKSLKECMQKYYMSDDEKEI